MKQKPSSLGSRLKAAWRELVWPSLSQEQIAAINSTAGAAMNRLTLDWMASCMSPDQEVKGTFRRLRARAREMERNNSWVASYLNLATGNVVGPHGFKHQPRVKNNDGSSAWKINDKLKEGWADWSQAVTLDGKFSLVEFEHQLLRTERRDGEAFVRIWLDPALPYGMALEAIDADLVDDLHNRGAEPGSNEVRMGIEVDGYGRPVSYSVFDAMYKQLGRSDRTSIPAKQIIHLYRPRRVNQSRGVTIFLPVMIALRMLEGYEEAELVAARAGAAKMGFFFNKGAADGEGAPSTAGPEEMDANPGTMEKLPIGWEFQPWDPTHPTGAFPAFTKSMLRKIASALGVSYNALTSDLESVNYSSMRSGLLIERDTWRTLQEWWARAFRTRVYNEWLNAALLSGDLVLDSRDARRFKDVKWSARGWPWVDPLKDTEGGVIGISNGLASRTQMLSEAGIDYEELIEELKEEQEIAAEQGVKIDGGLSPSSPTANAQSADAAASAADATANGGAGRAAVLAALSNGRH